MKLKCRCTKNTNDITEKIDIKTLTYKENYIYTLTQKTIIRMMLDHDIQSYITTCFGDNKILCILIILCSIQIYQPFYQAIY